MRILIVSNLFPPDYMGGQEINAWKIAHALRKRGHDVQVATSKFRPSFKQTESEPDWVHRLFHFVEPLPDKKSGNAARFEIMKKLADRVKVAGPNSKALDTFLAKEAAFDLVYPFGMHQVSLGTMLPVTKRGLPTLWHCGDHFIADHFAQVNISRLYRLTLEVLLKPWFDMEKSVDFRHMAFVSQYLLDHFVEKGFTPEHAYIVPRGIDFELGTDVERQRTAPPTFFMACRIDPTKGVHHAVEAAGALLKRRPDLLWQLEIAGAIGDNDYMAKLDARVTELGMSNRFQYIGMLTRPQTLERLRNATAFLSTSVWGEPFANTIIETLGSGTPLIGSKAGSILEVVRPGESALIYDKESPDELSVHMERVLDDPELRVRIARSGVEVIQQRYTLDRIMDLTEEVFAKVIADYRGKS
ncbi:MAG TPA: glycosyltransferase family 4 protein [Fimbriimonadaceae bacterium]|nr:glycosyltransferase family 4 protein [Fimbriimonadaceae bacterium]